MSLVWDDSPLFSEEFKFVLNGYVCKEESSITKEDETGGEKIL